MATDQASHQTISKQRLCEMNSGESRASSKIAECIYTTPRQSLARSLERAEDARFFLASRISKHPHRSLDADDSSDDALPCDNVEYQWLGQDQRLTELARLFPDENKLDDHGWDGYPGAPMLSVSRRLPPRPSARASLGRLRILTPTFPSPPAAPVADAPSYDGDEEEEEIWGLIQYDSPCEVPHIYPSAFVFMPIDSDQEEGAEPTRLFVSPKTISETSTISSTTRSDVDRVIVPTTSTPPTILRPMSRRYTREPHQHERQILINI